MNDIKFEQRPIATGNSFRITIPKYYVRAGSVDPTKKYEVTLREIETASN